MRLSQLICVSARARPLISRFIASYRYSARRSFFFNCTIAFVGRLRQNMRCAEFDTLGRGLIDHASEIIRGRVE
jgi:hypothetical protein